MNRLYRGSPVTRVLDEKAITPKFKSLKFCEAPAAYL
jgi:hypothetical protein